MATNMIKKTAQTPAQPLKIKIAFNENESIPMIAINIRIIPAIANPKARYLYFRLDGIWPILSNSALSRKFGRLISIVFCCHFRIPTLTSDGWLFD